MTQITLDKKDPTGSARLWRKMKPNLIRTDKEFLDWDKPRNCYVVVEDETVGASVQEQLSTPRAIGGLAFLFGGCALGLAAMGIYGLTAYAVGRMAGVDPGVVKRFLTGERDIRMETADRLAAALGLRLVEVARRGPGRGDA